MPCPVQSDRRVATPLRVCCRFGDDTGANGIKLLCRNGKELDVSLTENLSAHRICGLLYAAHPAQSTACRAMLLDCLQAGNAAQWGTWSAWANCSGPSMNSVAEGAAMRSQAAQGPATDDSGGLRLLLRLC